MPTTPSITATETDQDRIDGFNRTEHPFPDHLTLQQLFEAQVSQTPDAIAVICDHDKAFGTSTMTFAELNTRTNRLAHALRASGVGPGSIVGLIVERSFSMILGLLAVLKAGGAYLPIAPENPPDRVRYLLDDAGVRVLLVQNATSRSAPFDGETIFLENPESYRGSEENPAIVNQPTDLAYVIYTSGSTGRPKGVMVEHRSVVNRLHWMQVAYPIAPGDVILQK
ncbi:MAG: AMP-binding protein, partial [Chthoniobacter sp.]|uniref:AMP-binding protein n=1 Tax=Chthoniobacter sp. TaxID=2510640 RepID=UPI0032A27F50